jgi:peptide/nickel transport system permease protein
MATASIERPAPDQGWLAFARRHPTLIFGAAILLVLLVVAIAAPWIATHDPMRIAPRARLRPPSAANWFGTDHLGRDLFSRVVYGTRVSLQVGAAVALLASVIGLAIGLLCGFVRRLDNTVMRVMDGIMAIPGILLAFALVALTRPGLLTVVLAIAIPEIPRVTRLVRSVVLTVRETVYVDAARTVGTPFLRLLFRHILPNAMAPLVVQGSYVFASAVIAEAILSFLGAGIPPDMPSWGNIVAEARERVLIAFHIVAFPGLMLTITVLAVNLLGDGLRDGLDPRLRRRV